MTVAKAYSGINLGVKNPFYGKHHSEATKALMRQKITPSSGFRGRHHTEEVKAQLREMAKGNQNALGYHHTEERKAKMRLLAKRQLANPEDNGMFGRHHTEETKAKILEAMRLACCMKPNKAEIYLAELLENICPGEWAYVGDGQLIIAGRNPDFANINGKKQLIELYGDWWHRGEDPQDRIALFSQYGYKTLIIWESELKQPQEVIKRIVEFSGVGLKPT